MDSDQGWQADAACVGKDPNLFFSHDPADEAEARRICAACPVRADCLADAVANNSRHDDQGIWGGTDHLERRTIRDGIMPGRVQAVDELEETARRVPPAALLEVLGQPDGTYIDATGRVVVVPVDRAPRWVVLVDDRMVARNGSLAAARASAWVALHTAASPAGAAA